MKQYLFLSLLLSIFTLSSCSKTDTTTASVNLVGTWKLDKVTPSKLTGVYANLNNQIFDALTYFAFESVITLNANNAFTDKEIDNGITTNYSGSWTVSGNTLTLKFTDNSVETFTYDDTTKKLSFNDINTVLTFNNPQTKRDEDITCDAIYLYVKQ
jgi:Lipocalin-like domain